MTERVEPPEPAPWCGDDDRAALEWYQTLVGTVSGGVFQLDGDDRIVAIDETLLELTGFTREALYGEHVSLLLGETGVEALDGDSPGGVTSVESPIRTATGGTIPCELRFGTVPAVDGRRGSIGIVRELDADSRTPAALESDPYPSLEPITTVLEEADVGVFVLDDEFDVVWINDAIERYFGLDATAVIGRDKTRLIDETIRHRVADSDRFADIVTETYETNSDSERFELRVTPGETREERWLEHRSKPIESGPYAGGRIELYYDVTDQRRRAYQLRRLNEAVREWLGTSTREAVAEQACRDLLDILDLEINGVYLHEPEAAALEPAACSEPAAALFDEVPTFGEGEGIAWRVFESGDPVISDDVTAEQDVYNPETPIRSEICLPIGDHGVVIIGSEERDTFDEGDLSLAKVVASSLEATFDRIHHERNLERERTQTEKLLQTVPVAISVEDADGETLLANRYVQAATGLGDREPLGETELLAERNVVDADGEPIDPENGPSARVRATGEAVRDETFAIEGPSGERTWFSVTAVPVFGPDGSLERVVSAGEDVTALKEQERRLERQKHELETELSEILGRVSDAFYALDDEWRFTHVNDRAAELLGYDATALVGEDIWETFPSGARSDLADRYHEAMETQNPVLWERYSGSLDIWMEIQAYPSETGLSVYFRDISDRKQRERQLEQYERIIETIEDGIYVLDEDSRFTMVNDAYVALTGYDRDELLGSHASLVVEEPVMELAQKVAVDESDEPTIETEIETKSGEQRPIEATVTSVTSDGAGRERIGVVRDVTERKERQRRLEESNERLEQFAYAASHDLQEPLRMVTSYLQLIDNRYADDLDADGREFIDFAVDGAERMREMIDGLLEYSRVETQGDPLEPVDLEEILDDVRADLQFTIDESDAEITVESLPRVAGDASQLRQVFQNLLANAIEYSGDEPPRVRVSAERTGRDWEIAVRDDGIGIDPENQNRIFQVFQRLHSREDHAGTGIGLALCHRIVERHGGEIRVDSEPGEGSTFTVALPAAAAAT
ncbi:PAS domain S-box protein [Natrinema salaciae]|uniref:histidine kinase n=1 Tax=Natrinema salaciae TaxID=1186196 RepID=A0A1H9FTE9_9EURY|nr:PAS domain S-box protein [Natrinema salaciae]SEQ41200.1 PAS domain S-box-containing protein [Natrinema salaciae]